MSTGDSADMASRLRGLLPARWFPDPGQAPVLEALLGGLGAAWAAVFAQILFAQAQTRLRTVSNGFLDMAVGDFRGAKLRRRAGESDDKLRARLLPIFRERATRAALSARLAGVSGTAPRIFEPSRPADTGAYGTRTPALLGTVQGGGTTPAATQALPPPVAGAPVWAHMAPPAGDTNTGYFAASGLAPGTTLAAQTQVWLPAGYSGAAPTLSLEGNVAANTPAAADLSKSGQWQRLALSGTTAAAGSTAIVLRAAGAGSSNAFYSSAWGATSGAAAIAGTASGYGAAGGYGSMRLPNQLFVALTRPSGQGIPLVGGYGTPAGLAGSAASLQPAAPGGYGGGAVVWARLAAEAPHVTDADLYALVADTLPAASTAWVALGGAPAGGAADLGEFVLGVNTIA